MTNSGPSIRLIAQILVVACFAGALTAASAAPRVTDKWALWSGPTVRLRGANIFQRRNYPELDHGFIGPGPFGPPYTQWDFDRLASLGANFVNLSVPGIYTENPPYTLDDAAQLNLDNLIEMASRANLYAVISFRTGPGRSEATFGYFPPDYTNEAVWSSQAAQDAWVEMWRATAIHYENNPVVIGYDLMVEPNSNETLFNEWDPTAFYAAHAGTLADWNQLHPRISAAIRSVDSETPILTGGMAYSSIDWLAYLATTTDAKTVYTVHYYEPHAYTHQDPPNLNLIYPGIFDPYGGGTPVMVDRNWLRNNLAQIDDFRSAHPGTAVAINEFGVKRWVPGAAAYITDLTSIFEEKGVAHAIWIWTDSYGEAQATDDFNFRNGPDPTRHIEVPGSALYAAVIADFARNTPPSRPRNRAVRH